MDDMNIRADQEAFLGFMADLRDVGSDAAVLRKFCDGDSFACVECQQNAIPDDFFFE